jgi:hypothetical protein
MCAISSYIPSRIERRGEARRGNKRKWEIFETRRSKAQCFALDLEWIPLALDGPSTLATTTIAIPDGPAQLTSYPQPSTAPSMASDDLEAPDARASIYSNPACPADGGRSNARLASRAHKVSSVASLTALLAASSLHHSPRRKSAVHTTPIQLACRHASLAGLSTELILMILGCLTLSTHDSPNERRIKRSTLASCAALSRNVRSCALELLYRFVEVGSFRNSKKLLKTLHSNKSYPFYIKELILPDQWNIRSSLAASKKQRITAANSAVISEIISLCPRLHKLQMSTTKDAPIHVEGLYFDEEFGPDACIRVAPLSNLRTLQVSHHPFYDFTVRAPLPVHIEFTELETLSLHRFVIWSDNEVPMEWPPLPRLKNLCLEECFLHGDEVASLLTQVKSSIRTVRLVNSIFSISVISEGLTVVADVLEELFVSEHWGFDDNSEAFKPFTALRVLRLEPGNWGPHVYEKLPPKLECLAICSTENPSFSGWRVVEDVLGFLQTDVRTMLPNFKVFQLKAEASQFGPWMEHIESLCEGHGIEFSAELIESERPTAAACNILT